MRKVFSPRVLFALPATAAAFLALAIFPSVSMAASWNPEPSGTNSTLVGVSFVDQNHGWAVGGNVPLVGGGGSGIFATSNGGSSWSPQTSPVSDRFNGVSFVDQNHGWVVGGAVGSPLAGAILATTNGGASWSLQTSPPGTPDLYSVKFVDQSHGWAVGAGGTIIATTDGGATWTSQTSGTTNDLYRVFFLGQNDGYAVGQNGTILSTTDGGATWTSQTSGTSNLLYGVSFVDQNRGWAVGAGGTILHTVDGGAGWSPQASGTANDLYRVFFLDQYHGWAVGQSGTILVTTNGGANWSPQASGTGNWLADVDFTDLSHGWIVGTGDTILATTNTSYWTWYDDVGGSNWVLIANPASAPGSLVTSQLSIGGRAMSLAGYNNGVVAPGHSITPIFPGVMNGPVKAVTWAPAGGILSQRSLWPHGGSSMEEVNGTERGRLSNHFYWTWYDMQSPGYSDWVLVSNPGQDHNGNPQGTVSATVKIGGAAVWSGAIAPGGRVTPTFPGRMGGPVEVISSGGDVLASQRVLSNYGTAFNEVPGIPAAELSDRYFWTWYDMQSAGAKDWVLVANPNSTAVTAHIWIAGHQWNGTIGPGQHVTPTFPGLIGGPVEVWTDGGAKVIATQRSIFGPSFEEVPGLAASTSGNYYALASDYNWTWYDQRSPGMTNWVLVANPGWKQDGSPQGTVTATVKIGGVPVWSGTIAPGANKTPTFAGKMGGPVEVSANGNVIASQRVLYNGYFNEVLGQ